MDGSCPVNCAACQEDRGLSSGALGSRISVKDFHPSLRLVIKKRRICGRNCRIHYVHIGVKLKCERTGSSQGQFKMCTLNQELQKMKPGFDIRLVRKEYM